MAALYPRAMHLPLPVVELQHDSRTAPKIISGFALSVVMVVVLLQVDAALAQCPSPVTSPDIKVELPSQARVRAGEPFEIRWKSEGQREKGCRYPLYLVFTTRAHARFEGEWFLAFPAGGAGPFGIAQAIDQTRIFIPLHALADKASGAFKVKLYTAGENTINWFLVGLPGYFSGGRDCLQQCWRLDQRH